MFAGETVEKNFINCKKQQTSINLKVKEKRQPKKSQKSTKRLKKEVWDLVTVLFFFVKLVTLNSNLTT